jgi:UDP-glucose 4-epimerase
MSLNAQAQGLSAAISSFQIGNRTWKIGDIIHSIGTKAIEKRKMVETFGAQYETGRAEGAFLG